MPETNTGDHNTGHRNTGHRNTGDHNPGDGNTGDSNTGYWNTGYGNTGCWNTGYCNVGDSNTGDGNTGDHNVGNCNVGYGNTGDYNTGDCNTGDYNTGDCNTGFFCIGTPKATFFDKPTDLTLEEARELIHYMNLSNHVPEWVPSVYMTNEEKQAHPQHEITHGYLKAPTMTFKQAFQKAWDESNEAIKQRFLNLPNFDAAKFEEITGVKTEGPQPDTIVVNGKTYKLITPE